MCGLYDINDNNNYNNSRSANVDGYPNHNGSKNNMNRINGNRDGDNNTNHYIDAKGSSQNTNINIYFL